MLSQSQIRQQITDQIVAALQQGTAPWRKPWTTDPNVGQPCNAATSRNYRGVNPLILQIAADQKGFTSRHWATFNQWKQLGCRVKRRPTNVAAGKWGTEIVLCKPLLKKEVDESGEESLQSYSLLRTFTVFNADQVEGERSERFLVGSDISPSDQIDDRFENAEQVIRSTGAEIRFGGNEAFYSPADDYIQMPRREQFSIPEFYDTLFHELTHWTEHRSRLNWDRSLTENSYALGELIAELGSVYLSGELGLPVSDSIPNHASYIANWLCAMKDDTRFIFRAATQASKAADFLLSFNRIPEPVLSI